MMKTPRIAVLLGLTVLAAGLMAQDRARARQDAAPKPAGASAPGRESIEAINADYDRELAQLERRRLDRLARLAAGQPKAEAAKTYETYFRLAIEAHLYREAEPVADRVLKAADATPEVAFLAEVVNIVAEADRGAFEESLASLAAAIKAAGTDKADPGATARVALPLAARLSLVEAYYQRLVQAGRFDIARKAMQLLRDESKAAAVRDYAAGRLAQLDLVGKPAPAVAGTDVDGKTIRLADSRGDVVLVVFWASWCVPSAVEVARLDRVYEAQRGRGFRILGVNLDAHQDGGQDLKTVMPNIRRFLLDRNVRWPNLVDAPGEASIARAFRVAEIPANVLIGRDGKVLRLDLAGTKLETAVAEAVGR
jgi:peroxiredoxin